MTRFAYKRKSDIGLAPTAVVFRGKQKTDNITINVWQYDNIDLDMESISSISELTLTGEKKYTWIEINGLHDVDKILEIGKKYNIPQNIISEVLDPNNRPVMQEFEDGIFLCLKILHYRVKQKQLVNDNFSVIIKDNVLLTFTERKDNIFNPVKERLQKPNTKMRTGGSDYLAFTLMDVIIDQYIYIMGVVGDKIENLESSLYSREADQKILESINFFKRELNYYRKHVKPAKEMVMNLIKVDSECIQEINNTHFKELQDNIKEANDLSDNYREILYDMMNMYHTMLSTKLNDIIKVLTIFSVIFIPLTFIVGVYGTNFRYFPEIEWRFGYLIMWGVILTIALCMLAFFKRKKWF